MQEGGNLWEEEAEEPLTEVEVIVEAIRLEAGEAQAVWAEDAREAAQEAQDQAVRNREAQGQEVLDLGRDPCRRRDHRDRPEDIGVQGGPEEAGVSVPLRYVF